jgi:hypothetical protein
MWAACNALHPVVARMARWFTFHDRIDGNVIPLTQEALSELLGVRRTTVTHVVRKLRASGAVRNSDRRGLVEIARPRLEEATCECYEVMRRRFDQIFSAGNNEAAGFFSLTALGTNPQSGEVRCTAAIEGKADVTRTS